MTNTLNKVYNIVKKGEKDNKKPSSTAMQDGGKEVITLEGYTPYGYIQNGIEYATVQEAYEDE